MLVSDYLESMKEEAPELADMVASVDELAEDRESKKLIYPDVWVDYENEPLVSPDVLAANRTQIWNVSSGEIGHFLAQSISGHSSRLSLTV